MITIGGSSNRKSSVPAWLCSRGALGRYHCEWIIEPAEHSSFSNFSFAAWDLNGDEESKKLNSLFAGDRSGGARTIRRSKLSTTAAIASSARIDSSPRMNFDVGQVPGRHIVAP
jgi:hypothetical protein